MLFSMKKRKKSRDIDVILTSSGVRAPVFVGALTALEQKGYRIKRIAGTSGGAIIAAAYALGKTTDEMLQLSKSVPYLSFRDFKFLNLFSLTNPSVYSGEGIDNYLKSLFGDARLKDFKIDCKISVVTIVGRKRILLDKETYPELPVWQAVRMSSTIPFIFPYLKLEEIPVTDGGLDIRTDNIFPDRSHPVIVLRPRSDYSLKQETREFIPHKLFLWNYLKIIAEYLLDAVDLQHLEYNEWEKTIIIPTFSMGGFNFSIQPHEVENLVNFGYKAVSTSDIV